MQEQTRKWEGVREGVSDIESSQEVLRGVQDEEAMARPSCEEAVAVLSTLRHGLSERDYDILVLRAGVAGDPLTLREIGDKYSLTRERVRAILARVQRTTPDWPILEQAYPTLAGRIPSVIDGRESIRRYCYYANAKTPVQYAVAHRIAGVPIPENRKLTAHLMDDNESLAAFYDDYGVIAFGVRWKRCGVCGVWHRWAEYYLKPNGRPGYQCKTCNRDRCRDYQRGRREDKKEGNSGRKQRTSHPKS